MAPSLRSTLLVLAGACGADPGLPAVTALIGDRPCRRQVVSFVRDIHATGEAFRAPPAAGGATRYRLPTTELGRWVLIDLPPSGAPAVTRVGVDGAEVIRFDTACAVHATPLNTPSIDDASARQAFTDTDLRTAVNTGDRVIVYVWSPHMPLSVDGYPEIVAVADDLGATVFPVLMAGSDAAFAQREARRIGMPEAGLREAQSAELTFRDAQVHAPTIIVFAEGRISPALPGYRDAAGYRRFLERVWPSPREPANR